MALIVTLQTQITKLWIYIWGLIMFLSIVELLYYGSMCALFGQHLFTKPLHPNTVVMICQLISLIFKLFCMPSSLISICKGYRIASIQIPFVPLVPVHHNNKSAILISWVVILLMFVDIFCSLCIGINVTPNWEMPHFTVRNVAEFRSHFDGTSTILRHKFELPPLPIKDKCNAKSIKIIDKIMTDELIISVDDDDAKITAKCKLIPIRDWWIRVVCDDVEDYDIHYFVDIDYQCQPHDALFGSITLYFHYKLLIFRGDFDDINKEAARKPRLLLGTNIEIGSKKASIQIERKKHPSNRKGIQIGKCKEKACEEREYLYKKYEDKKPTVLGYTAYLMAILSSILNIRYYYIFHSKLRVFV